MIERHFDAAMAPRPQIAGSTALYRPGELPAGSASLQISPAIVLMFTCVHVVVFMIGFVGWAMLFAEPVLKTLTLPSILIGNLLAAGAMAGYFRRHHPGLRILP